MYLRKFARKAATPVSLENLFRFGKEASTSKLQRLKNAQFLHNELQVRIAQKVVELEELPLGLQYTSSIQDVILWYTDYFERVAESQYPTNDEEEEAFSDMLSFVLQDNQAVIEVVSRGVLEVRSGMGGFSVEDQRVVDGVLNRFYLSRIGLRFLIEHHLTSRSPRDGFSGIIQSECNPRIVVEESAAEAQALCEYHKGYTPKIVCQQFPRQGKEDISFTYVTGHLTYIVNEVLKNSLQAVTEKWGEDEMPDIDVTIVEGKNDIAIRVSDKGGGIDRAKLPLVWSYLHSTAEDPRVQEELFLSEGRKLGAVLAGYGVGLPLSRLYCRYFGGDMDMKSLEGHGTDVFLHLPRLGHNCENLPPVVMKSPAEGNSSLPRGESQVFFYGNRRSWQENVSVGLSESYHSTNVGDNGDKDNTL